MAGSGLQTLAAPLSGPGSPLEPWNDGAVAFAFPGMAPTHASPPQWISGLPRIRRACGEALEAGVVG